MSDNEIPKVFKVIQTAICLDCQEINTFFHLDDCDWRITGRAVKYFSYEGYCPSCEWMQEQSNFVPE